MSVSTSAPELPVAGIIPFSATDWPGQLTITVFTQGCPLRCLYCHNPTLQPFQPGSCSFEDALNLADSRRLLIDALVISGGEPTAVPGIAEAIRLGHERGFPVGLHTCGYRPKIIAKLLASPITTPDWVGLDVKALPEHMVAVTGCSPRITTTVWDSLKLLADAKVDLQVRTTLWPGSVIEQHLDQLRNRVADYGHHLVVQHATGGNNHEYQTGYIARQQRRKA